MLTFYYNLTGPMDQVNNCIPNPCGPHSQCKDVNNVPVCSCINNYVGRPPNCRPECMINAECPGNLACIAERCRDPCPGSCGFHASCMVVKHIPICNCDNGYTGDPFSGCSPIPCKFSVVILLTSNNLGYSLYSNLSINLSF